MIERGGSDPGSELAKRFTPQMMAVTHIIVRVKLPRNFA